MPLARGTDVNINVPLDVQPDAAFMELSQRWIFTGRECQARCGLLVAGSESRPELERNWSPGGRKSLKHGGEGVRTQALPDKGTSRQICDLEEELRTKLFDRTTRELQLNGAGRGTSPF